MLLPTAPFRALALPASLVLLAAVPSRAQPAVAPAAAEADSLAAVDAPPRVLNRAEVEDGVAASHPESLRALGWADGRWCGST